MAKKQTGTVNFETTIGRLEAIVEAMEAGDLSLEEAMAKFEEGVKLTRECHQALQAAEQKVKILIEQQGEWVLEDFATDDDDELEDDDH